MNVEVNLNAEEINKQVSEAILNSVLGSKLKHEIGQALAKILSTDYYGK